MPNMSYCCIENTVNALQQVLELIHEEAGGDVEKYLQSSSMHEQNAWPTLVELCTSVYELAVESGTELRSAKA